MSHVSMLRDYKLPADIADLRGSTLYGREHSRLGTVADVVIDHDNGEVRYLVVNAGHQRRVLVPRDSVRESLAEDGTLECDFSAEEIASLPAFEDRFVESREDWENFEELHRSIMQDSGHDRKAGKAAIQQEKRTYEEAPVQHIKGSANIITPADMPAEAAPAGHGGERETDAEELFPERLSDKFSDLAPSGSKLTMVSSGTAQRAADASFGSSNLDPRWRGFEQYLRGDVENIRRECPQCRLEDHRAA